MKIGQKVALKGKVSAIDTNLSKICFDSLKIDCGDGTVHNKDHYWVNYSDRLKIVGLVKGDTVSFTAVVRQYLGLDTKKRQIMKIGIHKLRNVRKEN